MSLQLLDYFLITQLNAFLLIFCRVGSAIMVLPGIGDSYVPMRFRLIFALGLAAILTPLLADKMPPMPVSTLKFGMIITAEILVGAFIGMIARTVLSVLHTAGTIIAYQSSLAVSSIFDPVTGTQTAVLSNFMTIVAMTTMFALNLHYLMIASAVESYEVFAPGRYPNMGDIFQYHAQIVSECFKLGVLLAAPHIIFSFVFYLMGGLMMRLMPSLQIIAVMISPQIIIAFLLLFAILPILTEVFTDFSEEQLGKMVGRL